MAQISMTNEAFVGFIYPVVNEPPRNIGEASMSLHVLDKLLPLTEEVRTGEPGGRTTIRPELIEDPTVVELTDEEVEFFLRRLEMRLRSMSPSQFRPIMSTLSGLQEEFKTLMADRESQVRQLKEVLFAKEEERRQLDNEIEERRRVRDALPDPAPEPEPSNGPVRS